MRASNLIITLILALFISLSLKSQSNSTHVISIHNDDESIHIEYEEGEVSVLKIDGVTISKKDYSSFQHIFNKYKDRTNSNYYDTNNAQHKNDMQAILLDKLKAYLSENERFDDTNFEFKLTENHMNVNGKKLSRDKLNECLEIFDKAAGYSLTSGSYFHVEISPGTRSVSLSINDN